MANADVRKYAGTQSKDGKFSCKIERGTNEMLDIYCRVNNLNKTVYVNNLVKNDMMQKLSKLKEE